ncbi:13825_t:CDS:2, partial [Racocetra fulgida]
EQGRLLQVSTGEGKRERRYNYKFPYFSDKRAEERKSFYEILGISCGSNEGDGEDCYSLNIDFDGENIIEFNKICYSNNMVYEDVRFGVEIVDELYNMIIDDSEKTARLTGRLAVFEHLHPIFCGVANELNRISKQIVKKEEPKIYGMTGTIGSKAEQELLSSIYEIDFGFIPTYKVNQFKEIEGI